MPAETLDLPLSNHSSVLARISHGFLSIRYELQDIM